MHQQLLEGGHSARDRGDPVPDEDTNDLAREIHELHEAMSDLAEEIAFLRKAAYAILVIGAAALGLDVNLLM
jgi:predicted nucleotidyltransferase